MESTIRTTITAQGQTPSTGTATILELTQEAKNKRALKAAGICVAIGVGSLAIPLVHFVLPWVMLIIAGVVYGKVSKQATMLLRAAGPCPACGESVEIGEQTLAWPIEWNCGGCRKRTLTQPADEVAAELDAQPTDDAAINAAETDS
ncbi:MAG: hypothetical protein KC502_19890 [Myxococcales bacterium]|nr:hypothetical protein [Myxococcales bacterium]